VTATRPSGPQPEPEDVTVDRYARPMSPSDTSAEASAVHSAVLAAMSPAARMLLAIELSEEIRLVTLSGIRSRQPDLDERQCVRELIRLWHGDAVAAAVDEQLAIG
jgi:hypothetical protein